MFKKAKNNRGVMQTDIGISLIVIVLFVSVITSLFYNIYLRGQMLKRTSEANAYIIEILENISSLAYDDIQLENSPSQVVTLLQNMGITQQSNSNSVYTGKISGYNITVTITKYIDLEENQNKENLEDVIKIITVKIEYNLSNETNEIEISTVKTR